MKAFENMSASYSFEYKVKVLVSSSFNHLNRVMPLILSKFFETLKNYSYCFLQLSKSFLVKTLLLLNAQELANFVSTYNKYLSVTVCKHCSSIFQLFYYYCYNFVLLSNKTYTAFF